MVKNTASCSVSTIKPLTKKQVEALRALFYGEVRIVFMRNRNAQFKQYYLPREGLSPVDITSRVKALCRKRMCRHMAVDKGLDKTNMPLVVTKLGEAELAKHPEET